MADVTLNTTSSIVDFLKSQGKPSDYSSRTSLYNTSGLSDRLGAYVGSAAQNTAFLKQLQTPAQTGAITPVDTSSFTPDQLSKFNYANTLGTGVPTTNTPPTPATPTPATPTPSPYQAPISATDALASIPQMPSTDEILGKVFNSPSFQNYSQGEQAKNAYDIGTAAAQKTKLEGEAAANTQNFINKMGQRGLYFSGETTTGIQALAESLASSKLGVDRKLASDLIQSDVGTRDKIMTMVEGVVKDAQTGRKDAIAALEKVGLTVIGDQVVPTLAAQSAARADQNAALAVQREDRLTQTAAFNQAATEQRLTLSEEAAKRAETSLQLSIDRAAGGGTVTSGGLTISKDQIGSAASTLNAARGADGWTDPYLYLQAYQDWVNKKGLPQDFVKAFPPSAYVNPAASGLQQNGAPLLPKFIQNNPSNNIITITPASINSALSGE